FSGGSIRYTENLTLGGDHLDRDVALGLSTPLAESRKLKEKHGVALSELVSAESIVQVEGVSGRKPKHVSKRDLALIIEPRMEEIFSFVKREIIKSGYKDLLPAGAVITGGTIKMHGTLELAERVLDMPVRIGIPTQIGGISDVIANPIYSTGVGLVQYGFSSNGNGKIRIREENIFGKVLDRMKNWFQEFF
ncbi:MAG: cell division protein FtsA, partial [Thermodesulfobacteriota bacterium]